MKKNKYQDDINDDSVKDYTEDYLKLDDFDFSDYEEVEHDLLEDK